MPDPFTLLGVPASATDDHIKAAYLEKVKAHPPEREPERFQAIRTAYEAIRSREARLRYRLFEQHAPDIDDLVADTLSGTTRQRPDLAIFQKVLKETLGLKSG